MGTGIDVEARRTPVTVAMREATDMGAVRHTVAAEPLHLGDAGAAAWSNTIGAKGFPSGMRPRLASEVGEGRSKANAIESCRQIRESKKLLKDGARHRVTEFQHCPAVCLGLPLVVGSGLMQAPGSALGKQRGRRIGDHTVVRKG
ncbi:hypothetical protein Emag_005977 [Eimeria magna]